MSLSRLQRNTFARGSIISNMNEKLENHLKERMKRCKVFPDDGIVIVKLSNNPLLTYRDMQVFNTMYTIMYDTYYEETTVLHNTCDGYTRYSSFIVDWKSISVIFRQTDRYLMKRFEHFFDVIKIQRAWRRCISDPNYNVCRKRLLREFCEEEGGRNGVL